MGKLLKNNVFLIFASAFILQLIVMPFAYHGDMLNHLAWGKYILEKGPSTIYFYDFKAHLLSDANYPPLMLWLCSVVVLIARLFEWVIWQINLLVPFFPSKLVFFLKSDQLFIYIFKTLLIFANLGIAWMAYILLKDKSPKSKTTALTTAALILFNPTLIYGSTLWGQLDILPIIFVLASIYFLFVKNNNIAGTLFIVTAVLFKQTTVIFLPIYFLAVLKYFGIKDVLKSITIVFIAIWFAYLPFVNDWKNIFTPFGVYLKDVQFASISNYASKSAWNVWALSQKMGHITDTRQFVSVFSYQVVGYILTLFAFTITIFSYWKMKTSTLSSKITSTIFAYFLVAFSSVLFLTRLHERHFLQVLVLFILLYNGYRSRLLQIIYLSAFIFANLVFFWHPWELTKHVSALQLTAIRISIAITIGLFVYYLWYFFSLTRKSKNAIT